MSNQKRVEWSKLDNASKFFPATCDYRDPKVFRISCELYDEVKPDILQIALDKTIERFPLYKSILRRGVFWYYFESSDIRPMVEKEIYPVCTPIYRKYEKNLLFRVFYYKKRINIEMFHALSDGTGALWFMKTLVYHYLLIRHKDELGDKAPDLNDDMSVNGMMDDSFIKRYSGLDLRKQFGKGFRRKSSSKVYHIKGTRTDEYRVKIIEGAMSAKAALEEAHKYNATLTVFFASLLIYSIYEDMPARKRGHSIVLSVPINLRQFFKSETARNFFSTMNITYQQKKDKLELSDVIASVNESFKTELTEERLNQHLDWLMFFERNPLSRVVPLPIKNVAIRIVNTATDMGITAAISNVGKVVMPPELDKYIHEFSVIPNVKRPQMTMCTYGDKLVVTFASPFRETELQKTFFRSLTKMGIDIEISSNT